MDKIKLTTKVVIALACGRPDFKSLVEANAESPAAWIGWGEKCGTSPSDLCKQVYITGSTSGGFPIRECKLDTTAFKLIVESITKEGNGVSIPQENFDHLCSNLVFDEATVKLGEINTPNFIVVVKPAPVATTTPSAPAAPAAPPSAPTQTAPVGAPAESGETLEEQLVKLQGIITSMPATAAALAPQIAALQTAIDARDAAAAPTLSVAEQWYAAHGVAMTTTLQGIQNAVDGTALAELKLLHETMLVMTPA